MSFKPSSEQSDYANKTPAVFYEYSIIKAHIGMWIQHVF